MTKRKSAEEKALTKSTRRKRVAFSAPKNAATKALIEQNGLTSPLLRMPLEIRNKIWREVLGDRLVHLRYLRYDHHDELSFEENEEMQARCRWSQKLQRSYGSAWRHVICEDDCPETGEDKKVTTTDGEVLSAQSHHLCEYLLEYDEPEPDTSYQDWYFDHETMHLSVLRSCRQIYIESNNVLWTSNTFSFVNPTTFRRFMMTRTINQKRLIKSLRLQMEWIFNMCHEWNKSLNIALVRSLTALRRLRLNIEHKPLLLTGSYESAKRDDLLYTATYFDGLKKLSTLPLTEVEVFVDSPSYDHGDHLWTKADRQDFADGLRKILLNPKGAQVYAEEQLRLKEESRTQREWEAEIKASRSRLRVQSQS